MSADTGNTERDERPGEDARDNGGGRSLVLHGLTPERCRQTCDEEAWCRSWTLQVLTGVLQDIAPANIGVFLVFPLRNAAECS